MKKPTFIIEEAVLGEDKPALFPQLESLAALLIQPALQDDRSGVAALDGEHRRRFDRRSAAAAPACRAGGLAPRLTAAVHAVSGAAVLLTVLPAAVQPRNIHSYNNS
jgi:hypothetical protein